jgi:toxin-antitoxin system PIN domain toxin
MRIPDVNVLIHARDRSSADHELAKGWIEHWLSGHESVGLATAALLGFVRIATNARVTPRPQSATAAFDQLDEWLGAPPAELIHPGRHHLQICRDLLEAEGHAGELTPDAHLAALAIERGPTLASFDSDFHRFGDRLRFEFLRRG